MVLRELIRVTVALSLTLGLFGLPGWGPDVCMVNKVGGEEGRRPWRQLALGNTGLTQLTLLCGYYI